MGKIGNDSSLAELLNYVASEGETSQEDLGKIAHESLEEVLEMTFGEKVASVLEGPLKSKLIRGARSLIPTLSRRT